MSYPDPVTNLRAGLAFHERQLDDLHNRLALQRKLVDETLSEIQGVQHAIAKYKQAILAVSLQPEEVAS